MKTDNYFHINDLTFMELKLFLWFFIINYLLIKNEVGKKIYLCCF